VVARQHVDAFAVLPLSLVFIDGWAWSRPPGWPRRYGRCVSAATCLSENDGHSHGEDDRGDDEMHGVAGDRAERSADTGEPAGEQQRVPDAAHDQRGADPHHGTPVSGGTGTS
jgi:hypothetical protein